MEIEYGKREQIIEKKLKEEKRKRDEMKIKHIQRMELAKQKQNFIQKGIEEHVKKDMERQDQDMLQKVKRHEEIERKRVE